MHIKGILKIRKASHHKERYRLLFYMLFFFLSQREFDTVDEHMRLAII